MNENARKWVAALRSGKYTQGCYALSPTPETDCCLGVACKLYAEENPGWTYNTKAKYLPFEVQSWLRLTSRDGHLDSAPIADSLAVANDDGLSFNRIAALIENHKDVLFD